jgi:cobalamin transport system permease protein
VSTAVVSPTRLRLGWILVACGVLLGAMAIGTFVGPVRLPPASVLAEVLDRLPLVSVNSHLSDQQAAILWELRIPRVLLAAIVGAMLSLAGASYQGVFRNPLADPYLLGVAAGAGLGATLAIAYLPQVSNWPVDPLPLAAFVGALVGVFSTYTLGRAGSRTRTATTLVLAGVAMASFFTAIQAYVQQRESDTIREVYTWILGRLTTSSWEEVRLVLPYVLAAGIAIMLHRRLLDVLSVGDEEADSLGINTRRVRLTVVIAASLGTAAAVAVSGLIGFVGVIVPHTVRLLLGGSYRLVLPFSIAGGAAFLILADLAGRTLIAPAEIPIGVITAFLGAPFFIFVLQRNRRLT